MKCPSCGEESRKKKHGVNHGNANVWTKDYYIKRRRRCSNCNYLFSTIEITLKDWNYIRYKVGDLIQIVNNMIDGGKYGR